MMNPCAVCRSETRKTLWMQLCDVRAERFRNLLRKRVDLFYNYLQDLYKGVGLTKGFERRGVLMDSMHRVLVSIHKDMLLGLLYSDLPRRSRLKESASLRRALDRNYQQAVAKSLMQRSLRCVGIW